MSTAWMSLVHVPGIDRAARTTTIGVFASKVQADREAVYGQGVPLESVEKHCRVKALGGVYFTRQDQSFGVLYGILAEHYPELI